VWYEKVGWLSMLVFAVGKLVEIYLKKKRFFFPRKIRATHPGLISCPISPKGGGISSSVKNCRIKCIMAGNGYNRTVKKPGRRYTGHMGHLWALSFRESAQPKTLDITRFSLPSGHLGTYFFLLYVKINS